MRNYQLVTIGLTPEGFHSTTELLEITESSFSLLTRTAIENAAKNSGDEENTFTFPEEWEFREIEHRSICNVRLPKDAGDNLAELATAHNTTSDNMASFLVELEVFHQLQTFRS